MWVLGIMIVLLYLGIVCLVVLDSTDYSHLSPRDHLKKGLMWPINLSKIFGVGCYEISKEVWKFLVACAKDEKQF